MTYNGRSLSTWTTTPPAQRTLQIERKMKIQPVSKERLEREKEKRSGIFERMFANVRSVSIHRLSEMLEKAIAEGDKEAVKRLNDALSDALDDIEKMQP